MTKFLEGLGIPVGLIRPIIIGVIVLLLVLIVFTAFQCQGWRGRAAVEAQADQTTASGEAISKAGSNAVDTVVKRGDADNKIDAGVASGQRDISNAETSDDVYAAVVRQQCLSDPSYRSDPACAVFYARSR